MITYYLSGPMSGHPEHNYPLFHEVESALSLHLAADYLERRSDEPGFEIVNPARNFGGDRTRSREEYMQLDLESVLRSDVIVLLPGWETSEGAGHETRVAQATGKRFMLADHVTDEFPSLRPEWAFIPLACLPATKPSPRADALAEASALITGDRNNVYGPPTQDFQRAADAATAYGYRSISGEIRPHDIAILVMLVKLSRLQWTPGKRDSWVDIAGYAGCGYECAVEEARADG